VATVEDEKLKIIEEAWGIEKKRSAEFEKRCNQKESDLDN
jgi:hypothetical protein